VVRPHRGGRGAAHLGMRDGRRLNPAAMRCGSPVGQRREGHRRMGGRGVAGGDARELTGGRVDTSTGGDRTALGENV
jgi:hypothetical protein